MNTFIIIAVFAEIIFPEINAFNVIRRTEYGFVKGQIESSRENQSTKYYAFRKIPYAAPPIGNLRFQINDHKMNTFIIIAVFAKILFSEINAFNVIRRTEYGFVKGQIESSRENPSTKYYAFRKVPYARPPIGNLRFQEPVRPRKWYEIKDTATSSEYCAQISNFTNGHDVIGSEDCLYIDVFDPKTARENCNGFHPLPVMVWFHGGAFVFGTSNFTGPDYLMEKPVVIVGVQYRLNVLGFLSTRDQYAAGNVGLKDQRMALEWVRNNIRYFGGDPNKVTIFGESAGGASVIYHMLSARSKGLFHRAISQSGTAMNRWAHQENPKEMTLKLSKGLGIDTENTKLIIEKLQYVDYKTLVKTAADLSVMGFYTPYYAQPFIPSIEHEHSTAFISDSMYELLKAGKYHRVPYMQGYNTEEGAFAYDYIANGRVNFNIYNENPGLLIPISMNVPEDSDCREIAITKIKEYYFKDGVITDKVNWIPYMSQDLFIRGIMKTMEFMYKNIPVYFYKFSFNQGASKAYLGGVAHYQEMQFIWFSYRLTAPPVESEAIKLTRRRVIELWTNFAYYGNPTPTQTELLQHTTWLTAYPNKAYMDIGDNLVMLEKLNDEDSKFWDDLYEECGFPTYVTY